MNWYQAESTPKKVTQIVVQAPARTDTNTIFGRLLLYDEHSNDLIHSQWGTGFSRLTSDKQPVLVIRADRACPKLRACPVTVAFSFYRMSAGGLATIFVHVDCPEVASKLKFPIVLFERAYGCDTDAVKALVRDAISREAVHLCFSDGQGADGPPTALFDVVIPLPAETRQALKQEFESLIAYHSSTTRDYQRSVQQMWEGNPQDKNPILPPPAAPPATRL